MSIGLYPGNPPVKFSFIQLSGDIFSNNIWFLERINYSLGTQYTVNNFLNPIYKFLDAFK